MYIYWKGWLLGTPLQSLLRVNADGIFSVKTAKYLFLPASQPAAGDDDAESADDDSHDGADDDAEGGDDDAHDGGGDDVEGAGDDAHDGGGDDDEGSLSCLHSTSICPFHGTTMAS